MKIMTNMELQAVCIEAGQRYVAEMFPGLEDLERKAWLTNAAAAGFAAGWRAAMDEIVKEIQGLQKGDLLLWQKDTK